jgi:UDP-3-O-[3-hydroxymyristoyl] N-acetylglucosamine deacetylase
MNSHQQTINNPIRCCGIGLHTGQPVHLTLKPAESDSGIRFVRVDLPGNPVIEAKNSQVVDTRLATSLGLNGYRIYTVEHLLSALAGLGIDNAAIELDSSEVPIMDGSAAQFTSLLEGVGFKVQNNGKKFLRIKRPVAVQEGDKYIHLFPYNEFKVSYTIEFDHPLLQNQSYTLVVKNKTFIEEISRARTFGFLKDVETLKQNGYAKGGSLENAVVIDSSGILNEEGLRFDDEFVRHKILDLIGDLSLLGKPILGHIIAYKSGHTLNGALIKKILSDRENYQIITQ